MNDNVFYLYADCLLSSFGPAAAAGLSSVLNGLISHYKDSISEKPPADENMMSVKHEANKDSVMPVRTNRKIAVNYNDRRQDKYVRADRAGLGTDTASEIFPENAGFPMLSVKQVFTDKDGSRGILYPAGSDTGMTYDQIAAACRRGRNAECYRKSLKQNASSEKSPAQTVTAQTDHFSASLCGCVKLEMLRFSGKSDHFALKAEIYISALQSAFSELQKLQPLQLAA